ncbi:MAG: hypothetical protein QXZ44_01905 [Ferroplasma sp.]
MKTKDREYSGKNINLDKLASITEQYFQNEKFKTQLGKHPNGTLIQATKEGLLRSIAGMDRAYTITISGTPDEAKISIGMGKWLQDLGVAAIESFLITPELAFLEVPESMWGFEIEDKFWKYIENQINLGIQ